MIEGALTDLLAVSTLSEHHSCSQGSNVHCVQSNSSNFSRNIPSPSEPPSSPKTTSISFSVIASSAPIFFNISDTSSFVNTPSPSASAALMNSFLNLGGVVWEKLSERYCSKILFSFVIAGLCSEQRNRGLLALAKREWVRTVDLLKLPRSAVESMVYCLGGNAVQARKKGTGKSPFRRKWCCDFNLRQAELKSSAIRRSS